MTLDCGDSLSTSGLQWKSVRTQKENCQWIETKNGIEIECVCNEGFTKSTDEDTRCDDINECKVDTTRCNAKNQVCKNTFGSFICDCISGYEIQADGSCIDINECKDGHECDQICRNTIGSYNCDCHIEFKMKGNTSCEALPILGAEYLSPLPTKPNPPVEKLMNTFNEESSIIQVVAKANGYILEQNF